MEFGKRQERNYTLFKVDGTTVERVNHFKHLTWSVHILVKRAQQFKDMESDGS